MPTAELWESNYYFVKFSSVGGSRACTVKVDAASALTGYQIELPSPSDVNDNDSARGTPVIRTGQPRHLEFTSVTGHILHYQLGFDGFPVTDAGNFHVDTTPESDPSDMSTYNMSGTDGTAFVEPALDIMVIGNRCNGALGDPSSSTICDNTGGTSPSDWGRVHVHDLGSLESTIPQLDLEAWAYNSPVGLSLSGSDLLMAAGTYEGDVAAGGGPNDCSLVTLSWDGSTLALLDSFDDDFVNPALDHMEYCSSPTGEASDGFGAEPVPFGARSLFSLRHYGKLYRMKWNLAGTLTKEYALEFTDATTDDPPLPLRYTMLPEMSPVIGTFPEYNTVPYQTTPHRVMFGMQERGGDYPRAIYVAVDPLDPCMSDPSKHCEVSPDAYLIDAFYSGDTSGNAVWSPGSAGVYRDVSTDELFLAFVVATGAVTNQSAPTSLECDTIHGELPPRLHFYFQNIDAADNDWEHHFAYLYEPGGTANCYRTDPVSGDIEPIEVIGGTALYGPSAYVATTDGLFWEYNTQVALLQGAATHVLEGYSGPWPRFRKNNLGDARRY